MTVEEMMELAAETEPELIEKTAADLWELEHNAPEFFPEACEIFEKIATRVSEKEKTAVNWKNVGDWGKRVGGAAGTALAGTVLLSLGTSLANDIHHGVRTVFTKSRNYKRMQAMEGDVLREKGVSEAEARKHFNTVQKYAPDIAANPMAASAAVVRLAGSPAGNYDTQLKELLTTQKARIEAKYAPFDKPKFSPDKPDFKKELEDAEARAKLEQYRRQLPLAF